MALTAKKVYAILKRQISDMEAKLNSPVRYRGTVATADLLPLNPDIGDMYNIESKSIYGEAGMNVAWNGVVWDTMGAPIDMSLYIKSSELADWVKQQNKPTYTAEEVGALPADTKIPSKTSELKNDSGFLTKVPDSYLNGTDTTLKESGKAADAKATGDKFTEMSADISKKLDKNQGSENSGKIAGINESGDIVPMFPVGVEYNEETNCLEFGSDQGMKLNQGIGLDSTLTKTGFAADAGVTGKEINSLKESISNKITKFYASSQGETHLADSDDGKIMDMMLYGRSEQKQYSGKNLLNLRNGSGYTGGGVNYTRNDDGSYSRTGTATNTAGNVWFIGGYGSIVDQQVLFTLKPGTYMAKDCMIFSGMVSFGDTFVVEADLPVTGVRNPRQVVGVTYKDTIYPILTSDTDTSWEPYTGGIPSPNPDYPQEIKSVVNPTVKVCGKNLFNFNTLPEKKVISGVTFTAYFINGLLDCIEANGTADDTADYWIITDTNYDCTKNPVILSGCPEGGGNNTYSLVNGGIWSSDTGSGHLETSGTLTGLYIHIAKGFTAKGIKFRPMLRYASVKDASYEPYHEQTVTLPYNLYGVKVASGGNVTIDGQEYVSDYFDVERGKLVRRVKEKSDTINITVAGSAGGLGFYDYDIPFIKNVICNITNIVYEDINQGWVLKQACISGNNDGKMRIYLPNGNHSVKIIYELETPEEIDLAPEEIQALKELATYYPTTNISINSEQLDGYTVFNYPISMENGWNYVKQQIDDTRDYIYDMDARTQDTDLQAAEAYVNSEYAVALTELEV